MTKDQAIQHLAQAYGMTIDYLNDYRLTEQHTALELKAFCIMCDIMKELFIVVEELQR